jgi:hypothetical protein
MPRQNPMVIDNEKQKHYMKRLLSQFPELSDQEYGRKFHEWLHKDYSGVVPIESYEEFRDAYEDFKSNNG